MRRATPYRAVASGEREAPLGLAARPVLLAVAAGLVLGLAACGGSVPQAGGGEAGGTGESVPLEPAPTVEPPAAAEPAPLPPVATLRVVAGGGGLPGPSIYGSELRTEEGTKMTLAAPAVAPLQGSLAPVATVSPDGQLLAYNTWRWLREVEFEPSFGEQGIETGDPLAVPLVRLLDLSSGADRALEEGSMSPAFRSDGALAYVLGLEPAFRASVRFEGRVVVREQPDGEPTVWLDERGGWYVVYGWAGKRLVVYRLSEGEHIETLVLDGPGQVRLLADGAAVITLSPDGRHALLDRGESGDEIRLVELDSGKVVASLDLGGVLGPDGQPVSVAVYSGDWKGTRAIATARPGLLVVQVSERGLEVESVLAIDTALYVGGITEPRFLDDSATRVAAWSAKTDRTTGEIVGLGLVCDLVSGVCSEVDVGDPMRWQRVIYSTSTEQP